jgi:hypothetical protein
MDKPEGAVWVTTPDLLAHAQRHEPDATARTLEHFRNQGLLPTARRIGQQGRRPVYGYPAEALRQLNAVMLWRRKEKNPDWLRVLVWIDGWPIDLERVRRSFAVVTRQIDEGVTAELQRLAGLHDDPIAAAAIDVAGRRGKNAFFPRRGRMPAAVRAEAVELLLHCFVGDERPRITHQQASDVLRLLGLDAARAAAIGVPDYPVPTSTEDLLPDPALFGIHQLASTAESVTIDELVAARRDIKLVAVWLPIFGAIVGALTGGSGTITDIAGQAIDEPVMSVLLLAMVIALRRAGMAETIRELDEALQIAPQLVRDALTAQQMPREQLDRNLHGRPEAQLAIDNLLTSDVLRKVTDTAARQRRKSS